MRQKSISVHASNRSSEYIRLSHALFYPGDPRTHHGIDHGLLERLVSRLLGVEGSQLPAISPRIDHGPDLGVGRAQLEGVDVQCAWVRRELQRGVGAVAHGLGAAGGGDVGEGVVELEVPEPSVGAVELVVVAAATLAKALAVVDVVYIDVRHLSLAGFSTVVCFPVVDDVFLSIGSQQDGGGYRKTTRLIDRGDLDSPAPE